MTTSKYQAIKSLESRLTRFKVPPLCAFSVDSILQMGAEGLYKSLRSFFTEESITLAIRSSSTNEDNPNSSGAGAFESVLDVDLFSIDDIWQATQRVLLSLSKHGPYTSNCKIIYQKYISSSIVSGVVFTHELNTGAPYYVVNYDDTSGSTSSVTSGSNEYSNRTLYCYREALDSLRSERFRTLLEAVKEVEELLDDKYLDIEFALDKNLVPYIFQVRPISTKSSWNREIIDVIDSELYGIEAFVSERFKPAPGVFGDTTIFGQMPDWNPAELIGRAPCGLALSLYRTLITDNAWRRAREFMGYSVPIGHPLMVSLAGQPYIDTRLSFHSYLPKTLPANIGTKLVNHWLKKLASRPEAHDKIEFEIAITTYSFDIEKKLISLRNECLTDEESSLYKSCLKSLTLSHIQGSDHGSIHHALSLLDKLESLEIPEPNSSINQLFPMIENCIRFGTEPFAILARHGFIAKTLLISLVNENAISADELSSFESSIRTVASDLVDDMHSLQKRSLTLSEFMSQYGHLRPGTYDILSPRYDQINSFLNTSSITTTISNSKDFKLSDDSFCNIQRLLAKHSFDSLTPDQLLSYCSSAISGRERGKFVFTRLVSAILELIASFASNHGISREQISYIPVDKLLEIVFSSSGSSLNTLLRDLSDNYRAKHMLTTTIRLPQLLFDTAGVFVVPFQVCTPSFVTLKKVSGDCCHLVGNCFDFNLNDKIILIENADPGYDWIFTRNIKALITKYGGANSHMAIRCAEFGIPAAIGCGEQRFESMITQASLTIDCSAGLIQPLL